MLGNNRQTVNSVPLGARNNVITAKKNRKKELWHDDCIIPYRKMSETTFLALLHTEWCKKRCFYIQTLGSKSRNNVSGRFQQEFINGNNAKVP